MFFDMFKKFRRLIFSQTIMHVDLGPIAIMLQLVRPARAVRRLRDYDWLARMNESSRRVQWPAAPLGWRYHAADIGRKRKGCHREIGLAACSALTPYCFPFCLWTRSTQCAAPNVSSDYRLRRRFRRIPRQ